jgi:hypothetical protein
VLDEVFRVVTHSVWGSENRQSIKHKLKQTIKQTQLETDNQIQHNLKQANKQTQLETGKQTIVKQITTHINHSGCN